LREGKVKKLIVLFLALILLVLPASVSKGQSSEDTIVGKWQLGDDIVPYPAPLGDYPALDCDDITIYTGYFLRFMFVEFEYAYGNLSMSEESRLSCNHYWIVASDNEGNKYPYDMGFFWLDEQHLEYYQASLSQVLQAALMD